MKAGEDRRYDAKLWKGFQRRGRKAELRGVGEPLVPSSHGPQVCYNPPWSPRDFAETQAAMMTIASCEAEKK